MCSRRPRTHNPVTSRRLKQEKIDPPYQDAFSVGCGSQRRNANDVLCHHGRPTSNAARERSRVRLLRTAFLNLQLSLPSVPPDTKLSKLDVLLLATDYIAHLRNSLARGEEGGERGTRGGEGGGERFHASSVCSRGHGNMTRLRVHRSTRGTPYGFGVTGARNRQREEKAPLEIHRRFTEDRMNKPRFERHPTKKWPMRARLYDGIVNSAREPKLREPHAVDDTLNKTHQ